MVLGLFYSSFAHVLEVLVGKLRLSYGARFYGLKTLTLQLYSGLQRNIIMAFN